MVFYDTPCLPPHLDIDAHAKMTPKKRAMAFPVFAPKNAISAKSQQLGRLGWSCMIPLALLCAMKLTLMPIWRAIDAQLTRH